MFSNLCHLDSVWWCGAEGEVGEALSPDLLRGEVE